MESDTYIAAPVLWRGDQRMISIRDGGKMVQVLRDILVVPCVANIWPLGEIAQV